MSSCIKTLRAAIAVLRAQLEHDGPAGVEEEATHAGTTLLPAMSAVRVAADDLLPLATYQEMLFIL